jgi:hypothetical protein
MSRPKLNTIFDFVVMMLNFSLRMNSRSYRICIFVGVRWHLIKQ